MTAFPHLLNGPFMKENNLSRKAFEIVHRAVARRSITTVACVLGVSRTALANALFGKGRTATRTAIAEAVSEKSAELEAL